MREVDRQTAWTVGLLLAYVAGCGGNVIVVQGAGGTAGSTSANGGSSGGGQQTGGGGSGATCMPSDDTGADADGDGFSGQDDCDDRQRFVNPDAFEVAADGVDNDCDGKIDEPEECDLAAQPIALDTDDPTEMARSIGICPAQGSSPGNHVWGLTQAYLKGAGLDAAGYMGSAIQHAVRSSFGSVIGARAGASMLELSTGAARLPGEADWPGRLDRPFADATEPPPDGFPEVFPPCPHDDETNVLNPIALHVEVRVPSNAVGVTFDINFVTTAFPTGVCDDQNDTYVTLYNSLPSSTTVRKNITLTPGGHSVGVDAMEFAVCAPQVVETPAGDFTFECPDGPGQLAGLGYSQSPGGDGAATGWITSTATVPAGGNFSLDFLIWDGGPYSGWPSSVLIDNWRWIPGNLSVSCAPAAP